MLWRDESDLQSGCTSYEKKFKHLETEILINISYYDCFYGVNDDKDLMNITYGSVNEDDEEDSDSEYNMLDHALLDIDMPVQDYVDSSIGPALATVEEISISREEFYTLCSHLNEGQQQLFNFIMKHVNQFMLNERKNLPMYCMYVCILYSGFCNVTN